MAKLCERFSYLTILLSILILRPSASSECYYPDGTAESDPSFQPCSQFQGTTKMCCAWNRTNPSGSSESNGWTADICLPNGLCLNSYQSADNNGKVVMQNMYWRDQCTSQNWNDGGCLNVCAQDNTTYQSSSSTVIMTPCDGTNSSTTWCCGDTYDCCNSSSAIVIPKTLAAYVSTSSASATSTTSSQAPSQSSPGSRLSTGAKAGIGVGVSIGAIAILTGLTFFLRRKKIMTPLENSMDSINPPVPEEINRDAVHEMPGNPKDLRHELRDNLVGGD